MKQYIKLATIAIIGAATVAVTNTARAVTDDIVQPIAIQLTYYTQKTNDAPVRVGRTKVTNEVSTVTTTSLTSADLIKWLNTFGPYSFSTKAKLVRVIQHFSVGTSNVTLVYSNYEMGPNTNFTVLFNSSTDSVWLTYTAATNRATNISSFGGSESTSNYVSAFGPELDVLSDDLWYSSLAFSNNLTATATFSSDIATVVSNAFTTSITNLTFGSPIQGTAFFSSFYQYITNLAGSNTFVIQVRDGTTIANVSQFFRFDDVQGPFDNTTLTTNHDLFTGTGYDLVRISFGSLDISNVPSFNIWGFGTVTWAHSVKGTAASTNIYEVDSEIAVSDAIGYGSVTNGKSGIVKGSITIGPGSKVIGE